MTEDHDDFAFEPVPGLPDRLPVGETMLWQGSPHWPTLAVQAFHIRKIAFYFALVLGVKWLAGWANATPVGELVAWSASLLGIAALTIAILALLAWLYARGTIYTLTSKRFVFRSGLALPVTLNLPFTVIDTAAVTANRKGIGSVVLTVTRPNRIAYLVLWPNVRPWTFNHPAPMLRCVADAPAVGAKVAAALEAALGSAARQPARTTQPASGVAQPYPAAANAAA